MFFWPDWFSLTEGYNSATTNALHARLCNCDVNDEQYDPSNNSAADCRFHPGSPLFHEGLKSYTCCKDTNKPVDSFEDFLKIPGCTSGSHSSEQSEVKAPVVTANAGQGSQGANTSSAVAPTSHAPRGTSATNGKTATPALPVYKSRPSTPSTVANDAGKLAEEEDPEDVVIPPGAQCRRQGCKAVYNASTSRSSEECQYHPLSAIFHEGSKGYAVSLSAPGFMPFLTVFVMSSVVSAAC